MRAREYVGRAQWAVLRALCDALPFGATVAAVSAAAKPDMGNVRPAAAIESLMLGGLLEHACPPHDEVMDRWCQIRITERGENARLDKRGRKLLAHGR